MRARIIGTGSYLPESVLTNDDLSKIVDTSDEWISSRTGIRQRHLAVNENTVSMSTQAARRAMEEASVTAEELDLIIVATCSPDTFTPNTACSVQANIGAARAVAFDVNTACSGFVFALNIADMYMAAGTFKTALIIGGETLSRFVDWTERSTCVLFADGAGAAVLKADETGLISSSIGSDGTKGYAIYVETRPVVNPCTPQEKPLDYLYMDGQEVFKFAVRKVPEVINKILDETGYAADDVDWYILHQANARINSRIAKKLGVSLDKMPMNMDRCGNTSAASIPLLLDEVNKKGLIKRGDKVMLAGFGAGLTWGGALLEW